MIARSAAAVVLAGAVLLGTSGCTFFAEQATRIEYEPSDGTAAVVGDLDFVNVLALSAEGTTATLVFTGVNSGLSTQLVEFQYDNAAGEATTVKSSFPGDTATSIGGVDDKKIVLDDLDVTVGSLLPVYVQYGNEEGKSMLVPVLDGTLPEYAALIASAAVSK